MSLATLAIAALGAAAGYAGAHALLEHEALPEAIPAPLRDPLLRARARLLRVRAEAADVLAEAAWVRSEAERELTEDYLTRTGRHRRRGPA